MAKNIYEFYISFFGRDINCAYYLDVERETEKFYFGQAVLLDKETGKRSENLSRFRVEKTEIGSASSHRDYRGNDVYVSRVMGDDYFDAKGKALLAFGRYFRGYSKRVINWVNDLERQVSLENRNSSVIQVGEKHIFTFLFSDGDCKELQNYNRCTGTVIYKWEKEQYVGEEPWEKVISHGGLYKVVFEDGSEFDVYGDELQPVQFFDKKKLPLDSQIQSASTRAAETHSTDKSTEKASTLER